MNAISTKINVDANIRKVILKYINYHIMMGMP
jgi:hypothetical protein